MEQTLLKRMKNKLHIALHILFRETFLFTNRESEALTKSTSPKLFFNIFLTIDFPIFDFFPSTLYIKHNLKLVNKF